MEHERACLMCNDLHALMENKGCHRKAVRRQGTSTMCCTTHSPMPHPAAINSQMSACFMQAWVTIMFTTIRADPWDVLSQVSMRYFAYQHCAATAIAYIYSPGQHARPTFDARTRPAGSRVPELTTSMQTPRITNMSLDSIRYPVHQHDTHADDL